MTDGSRRAILAAFFANLGIAIAKLVGFVLTSSAGLLAEAGHSLADTGNQALLLLGGSRARRQADTEHPFGYGRERYFWSFVVALVLFSMGGLFALYEGIQKVRDPHEVESLGIAIGILVFAIALETFSLRTAVKEARHHKGEGVSWWRYIRTSKQPELPVVLLEDIGAELGLFFALGGVLLAHFTDNPRWDAVGSIAIGVLLVVIAILLAVEMKGLLIGEGASTTDEAKIRSTLEASPSVRRLIHVKTQHLGPDELLIAAKLEFEAGLSVEELTGAINEAERGLHAAIPIARLIYLEPDVYRPVPAGVNDHVGNREAGDPRPSPKMNGLLAVIGAVLAFSISSTLVKWADTPGSVIAFWRMVGAVLAWWVVIAGRRAITGRPAPSAAQWRSVLPAGLFFGLNIALFFTAISKTSIAHAEFITSLAPFVLVPVGAVLFHEHPQWSALRWGAVSLVGLAIVLGLGPTDGTASVAGDLLVLVVVGTWVGYMVTARRARASVDVVDFMATMMPIGLLTATPVALLLAADDLWPLTAKAGVAAALLTVLTGMLAHGLIAYAQRDVDVGTISVIQVSQPALAVVWAVLLLGEEVRGVQVPGMVLVIAGLVLFTLASRGRPPAGNVGADQHGELTGPVG